MQCSLACIICIPLKGALWYARSHAPSPHARAVVSYLEVPRVLMPWESTLCGREHTSVECYCMYHFLVTSQELALPNMPATVDGQPLIA